MKKALNFGLPIAIYLKQQLKSPALYESNRVVSVCAHGCA